MNRIFCDLCGKEILNDDHAEFSFRIVNMPDDEITHKGYYDVHRAHTAQLERAIHELVNASKKKRNGVSK